MNKSESKYYNTAILMDEALVKLLAEKDMAFISVKEICERAGVNRSTFYLHYETIGDLLEETIQYVISKFMAAFDEKQEFLDGQIKDMPVSKLVFINEKYLKPYLKFIYDNRSVFKAAVQNPVGMRTDMMYSGIKKHIIEPVMQRFQIPADEQQYWMAYYFGGIWAIVQEWINHDCREPAWKIELIIENCVRPERGLQGGKFGE